MNGEILFLAHRIPFPPDRGDKIRSHHILNALAQIAPVHVGCLAENEEDFAHEAALAAVAASHWMPIRNKPLPFAAVQALIRGEPISLAAFHEPSLQDWVEHKLRTRPIKAIYIYSGQMGHYVPANWPGRLIVDFVDVDSAKFESYGAWNKGPMAFVYAREGRLLREMEHALASRATVSLLVSAEEAALMQERNPDGGDIRALRNGIDCTFYDPALSIPHPVLMADPGPHFVFTGQMDYAPNVAAVKRFATLIHPAIRQRHPQAQFHIVGRAPTKKVLKLGLVPGVNVWGAVPDMRPFLAAADLVVAPLTIARGVQNKVLEAMAMGKPVLVSSEAAVGIDARHGEHLLICDTDTCFIDQALALLEWPGDGLLLGQAARRLVFDQMSWPAMLAKLPAILDLPIPAPDRRNAA